MLNIFFFFTNYCHLDLQVSDLGNKLCILEEGIRQTVSQLLYLNDSLLILKYKCTYMYIHCLHSAYHAPVHYPRIHLNFLHMVLYCVTIMLLLLKAVMLQLFYLCHCPLGINDITADEVRWYLHSACKIVVIQPPLTAANVHGKISMASMYVRWK